MSDIGSMSYMVPFLSRQYKTSYLLPPTSYLFLNMPGTTEHLRTALIIPYSFMPFKGVFQNVRPRFPFMLDFGIALG